MNFLSPWLGDLNQIGLGRELVGLICIFTSALCGALVGYERERLDKPAGLRTIILISLGSTIFTMVSELIALGKPTADPARLAAQIIPGIGFLGAGAIIHARGTVVGLTTGATIWAVAAVGVTIGAGYVAAGLCFTVVIYFTLVILHRVEALIGGRCVLQRVSVIYRPAGGKTLPRIQEVLDRYKVADEKVRHARHGDEDGILEAPVCVRHRNHRIILRDLAEIHEVLALDMEEPVSGK